MVHTSTKINKTLYEEFEDTKGAIRIRISKKNRQHNGQKIPKGQSESVYRRRTDNTMAKRKSTKEQAAIYKTLHRKLKIEQREKNHEMT